MSATRVGASDCYPSFNRFDVYTLLCLYVIVVLCCPLFLTIRQSLFDDVTGQPMGPH
mgnify:CR=1 FL=1